MKRIERAILIVLDSVGVGELPDAALYHDQGSNTLANTALAVGGLKLPNLEELGLGNITEILGVARVDNSRGAYGKMAEKSAGKDTTTGHWELAGLVLQHPFPTYPEGFPQEIISKFEEAIGCATLGNKAASGTEIIEELGPKHLETGFPIVYTSADSVFQIAAHEEIISVEELYRMCEIARGILQGPHGVGRVIARPFQGEPGSFQRTPKRKDYSLEPLYRTVLDLLKEKGEPVYGVGKIFDIFAGQGVEGALKIKNNLEGIDKLITLMEKQKRGLIFANLNDFDTLYGHRNNPQGYAKSLEEFDTQLPRIIAGLAENDLLIITADHGCDPTTSSTDHSREFVPLLVYYPGISLGISLGVRESFADVAQTIADVFQLEPMEHGKSFKKEILL